MCRKFLNPAKILKSKETKKSIVTFWWWVCNKRLGPVLVWRRLHWNLTYMNRTLCDSQSIYTTQALCKTVNIFFTGKIILCRFVVWYTTYQPVRWRKLEIGNYHNSMWDFYTFQTPKKTTCPENISVVVLKNINPEELSPIQVKLFNFCLKEESFPGLRKVSSAWPVFKHIGVRSPSPLLVKTHQSPQYHQQNFWGRNQ